MPNVSYPTQFGYTITGSSYGSQIVIGRNIDSGWEAVGAGLQGRPDFVSRVIINLTDNLTSPPNTPNVIGTLGHWGDITLDVADLISVIEANPNAPATMHLTLREFDVCDGSVPKKVMLIGCEPYLPP